MRMPSHMVNGIVRNVNGQRAKKCQPIHHQNP
jgi:hypothetical protein